LFIRHAGNRRGCGPAPSAPPLSPSGLFLPAGSHPRLFIFTHQLSSLVFFSSFILQRQNRSWPIRFPIFRDATRDPAAPAPAPRAASATCRLHAWRRFRGTRACPVAEDSEPGSCSRPRAAHLRPCAAVSDPAPASCSLQKSASCAVLEVPLPLVTIFPRRPDAACEGLHCFEFFSAHPQLFFNLMLDPLLHSHPEASCHGSYIAMVVGLVLFRPRRCP
jgi:hypothetical protein